MREASNQLEHNSPNRMIDNATIAGYNSDSKHRITRIAPLGTGGGPQFLGRSN
jgi:hypothetical protein